MEPVEILWDGHGDGVPTPSVNRHLQKHKFRRITYVGGNNGHIVHICGLLWWDYRFCQYYTTMDHDHRVFRFQHKSDISVQN